MPLRWRSYNQIDPTATFTSFLIAVLLGAKRFANWFRGDYVVYPFLGLKLFPSEDTIRNLFLQFTMGNLAR